MARLEAFGLPFAPIARPADLFEAPHLLASGGLLPIDLTRGRPGQPHGSQRYRSRCDYGIGSRSPPPAVLRLGSHAWNVTGYLGAVLDLGPDGTYFLITMTPDSWQFGAMRAWHFACAWILVLTWSSYGAYVPISGRLRRTLLSSAAQVRPRALLQDIGDHLRLKKYRGEEARRYNTLQKVTYLAVLFVLIPLAIVSGLTLSNAVTARFPELYSLLGGRQSARTLHALCAAALFLFVVVHVAQLFVAGSSTTPPTRLASATASTATAPTAPT